MSQLVVVQGDSVQGTDTHTVSGSAVGPPGTVYAGTGNYNYVGRMTGNLSTFVKIGGKPVAVITSQSSLNPGQTAPSGGHSAPAGSNYVPPTPAPIPSTLNFVPLIVGTGVPNAAAGSALLTIGGVKVLLAGDKIDTCDGTGSANSTVNAVGQSFVSCSG